MKSGCNKLHLESNDLVFLTINRIIDVIFQLMTVNLAIIVGKCLYYLE